MNDFAKKIKTLRENHNMTQLDLAKKLDMTPTAISYWESGKTVPNFDKLLEISKIFCVSVDYLLGNKTDENKENNTTAQMLFRRSENLSKEEQDFLYTLVGKTIDAFVENKKDGNKD